MIIPFCIIFLVFSSIVSFYLPLTVMIIVYLRIYIAVTREINAIKSGHKKSSNKKSFSLRIHRGGYRGEYLSVKSILEKKKFSMNQSYTLINQKPIIKINSFIMDASPRSMTNTKSLSFSLPNLTSSKHIHIFI